MKNVLNRFSNLNCLEEMTVVEVVFENLNILTILEDFQMVI